MFNSLDPLNGAAANCLTTNCSSGKRERQLEHWSLTTLSRPGCQSSSSTKPRAIVTRSRGSGS